MYTKAWWDKIQPLIAQIIILSYLTQTQVVLVLDTTYDTSTVLTARLCCSQDLLAQSYKEAFSMFECKLH